MTRANTEHPTGARGLERPKPGGQHSDALESGLPKDTRSEGAGTSDAGTGVTPSRSETDVEKGDYPAPGEGMKRGAAGPIPSTASAGGIPAHGATGDGRGSSGKFKGTMGSGQKGEPGLSRAKGAMGNV